MPEKSRNPLFRFFYLLAQHLNHRVIDAKHAVYIDIDAFRFGTRVQEKLSHVYIGNQFDFGLSTLKANIDSGLLLFLLLQNFQELFFLILFVEKVT